MATEEQITKILELSDHTAIDEQLAENVKSALMKKVSQARADQIIAGLEERIAQATPKPIEQPKVQEASPSLALVPDAAASATDATRPWIDEQREFLKQKLLDPNLALKVKIDVEGRLYRGELTTIELIEKAIADVDRGILPF